MATMNEAQEESIMISILKAVLGNRKDLNEEVNQEICLFTAIRAHLEWKLRLHNYLQGRLNEHLDHNRICFDDQCMLGKWIHGAGRKRFGDLPLFMDLVREHALFHQKAAQVVEAHHLGRNDLAKKIMLNEYAAQSKKTVAILMQLNALVDNADIYAAA